MAVPQNLDLFVMCLAKQSCPKELIVCVISNRHTPNKHHKVPKLWVFFFFLSFLVIAECLNTHLTFTYTFTSSLVTLSTGIKALLAASADSKQSAQCGWKIDADTEAAVAAEREYLEFFAGQESGAAELGRSPRSPWALSELCTAQGTRFMFASSNRTPVHKPGPLKVLTEQDLTKKTTLLFSTAPKYCTFKSFTG